MNRGNQLSNSVSRQKENSIILNQDEPSVKSPYMEEKLRQSRTTKLH